MASIQTFIGNNIAVQRKKKRTYVVLEWTTGSIWSPSRSLREGSGYVYGTSGLPAAPVKIVIGTKTIKCMADGDYLKSGNHIIPIVYKHSGTDNFPQSFYAHEFVRPTTTTTEALPRPLWLLYRSAAAEADPSLAGWIERLAPIPVVAAPAPAAAAPAAPVPGPRARNANWPALPRVGRLVPAAGQVPPRNIILPEEIPQRIAWIVAEDACKRGEDCSITLDAITPITAAVTSCFHVFDADAIAKWLESTPGSLCPMCKKAAVATVCFTE
jgi:hypothetical protein